MSSSVLAARLKQARVALGISQRELGIRAGIDEFVASARINQYERGKHVPDFATMERLAEVLGVPMPYFYARDDLLADAILKLGKLSEQAMLEVLQLICEKAR